RPALDRSLPLACGAESADTVPDGHFFRGASLIGSFGWLGRVAFRAVAMSIVATHATAGQRTLSDPAITAALSRISPSLVRIHVVTYEYEEGREIKREAAGSGTIISPEGHVLTNHHVAGRTRTLMCTLADREEIPADLVGTDPLS